MLINIQGAPTSINEIPNINVFFKFCEKNISYFYEIICNKFTIKIIE